MSGYLLDMRPRGGGGGSGAPVDAAYIVQTPNGTLTNEQALSALATGLLKNTTGIGVLSIATPEIDYASAAQGALADTALQPGDIGSLVQGWDADLDTLAGLSKADGNFIVGDGAAWVVESGATARASLGLGTIATQNANNVSISGGSIAGITDLAVADGGTGASTAANARTNLGLGTMATQNADAVTITGGTITEIGNLTVRQASNGADAIRFIRNTDTGPTGTLLLWMNAAQNDEMGRIDALGRLIVVDEDGSDLMTLYRDDTTVHLAMTSTLSNHQMLRMQTTGAAAYSFVINTDGEMSWGPGSSSLDTFLYRIDSGQLQIDDRLGIGIAPSAPLHVMGTNGEFRLQNVNTDLTNKNGRMTVAPYNNSHNPVLAFLMTNLVSSHLLSWGGGSSVAAAVTQQDFYAAAAVNTTTGTNVLRMTTAGLRVEPSGVQAAATTALHVVNADSGTANMLNIATLTHNSSGTPTTGFGTGLLFQGKTSTTINTNMSRRQVSWAAATHGSQRARVVDTAYDSGGEREYLRGEASGTAAMIGFLGASAVARPAAYTQTYSTADRTLSAYTPDTENVAYTGAADGEAKLTDLNALRVAYENLRAFVEDLAQLTNSTIDDLQAYGLLA